jgi:IgA Peptidase M64
MTKKLLLLFIIALICHSLFAQTFPVETIFENGAKDKRINLVFLSDGYQATELDRYITDVNTVLSSIFTQSPFQEYKNYFNAYAIKIPSLQSGASHPRSSSDSDCKTMPQAVVDNYFGSRFDIGGIHRLLVPQKDVGQVLAANFPDYDQAFILVNTPHYGGSGGTFATSSTHLSASEISIHEIGHSFAGLADEYWAGANYAQEKLNMTQTSSVDKVKWRSWLGENGIGVYAHQESPTWYRPHQNCKMRTLGLGSPYCNVCKDAFVERFHALTKPLNSYDPVTSTTKTDSDLHFSVDLIKTIPNTFKIEWRKDYTIYENDVDEIKISANSLNNGTTIIEAEVVDNTSLTRAVPHFSSHVYTITWNVIKTGSEVTINSTMITGKVITETAKFSENNNLIIYPNPFIDHLNVSYSLARKTQTAIIITDEADV